MHRSLIANPYASRVTEERIRAVAQRLGAVETLLTERRGHATELAAGAEGDAIFVFGGDGVVNEVLNGLPSGKPLGIVSGGKTNVFARALGVPRDPAAARAERRISLVRVNGRRFGFASGIGVDSEAVRELDTIVRSRDGRHPGSLAYARVVAQRLRRGYAPRLELENLGRASILFVSNGPVFTYAGPLPLRLSPAARFELGFDATAPVGIDGTAGIRLVGRVVAGRGLAGAGGVLAGHDLDRLRVVCDAPFPLQADGEDLGDVTEAVFEAERGAIAVLV
ncbi:MAG TPA: diacylglycerol kinase family protein [Gaiellaceae bacterium]|nr:diacylglycerol kinase family protein [Gaiellaceae bacterium]